MTRKLDFADSSPNLTQDNISPRRLDVPKLANVTDILNEAQFVVKLSSASSSSIGLPDVNENIHDTDEDVKSASMFSKSDESASARTLGSWDLPTDPVAWDDKDRSFMQLLNYADLTLTEEEENGLLTDRIIAACASYLTRSPASKCHVVAKLVLDNKNLSDIRIIGYHRFLQYVDLSWNNIKDLSPLGNLPYLMYLDVSHNLLEEVLRFKPPWNLTYVNYSYNEVWRINDLSDFWSLSYLDLSHNKISKIQGLDTLRYLRYLNLSYNKITRFENLNNTRITDLNLEYNIISSFESGEDAGIKTMVDLSSLCLNNNLISDLEFLKEVYHLKKLELQGNRITNLMELSNMKTMRKLRLLDLAGNPVCQYKPYRNMLLNILPELKFLDQTEVDVSEKVPTFLGESTKHKMEAAKNNARMVLLDQLNDATINLDVFPIDQTSYPLVILVGPSASRKKLIVSKLGEKHSDKIFVGKLHTTRDISEIERSVLIRMKREEFNERIKNGYFFCVMENLGHFYGFSKETLGLAVKSHKLCLTYMDLEGALTVRSYGMRPYLVLTLLNSEKEHQRRLKENYGPIITLLGAAYVSKRELADTHASNVRRIREIMSTLIEEVVFWVEERHNFCFSQLSHFGGIGDNSPRYQKPSLREKEASVFGQYLWHSDYTTDLKSYHFSEISNRIQPQSKIGSSRDIISRLENINNCSTSTCIMPEKYKEHDTTSQDTAFHSVASTTNSKTINFEGELREEGSGTCSTSYSAVVSPPMRIDRFSYDDEGTFGEEGDVFADWSSPFIDWDEINVDPVALEEAAEELCESFIRRILATRSIYQSIHLDNPGLFSHVLLMDNEEEAAKNLMDYLKEVWRSVPTRDPVFDIKKDYAYKEIVPKRLDKLKNMIREGSVSKVDDPRCPSSFPHINSPRSIVTQMELLNYEIPEDNAQIMGTVFNV